MSPRAVAHDRSSGRRGAGEGTALLCILGVLGAGYLVFIVATGTDDEPSATSAPRASKVDPGLPLVQVVEAQSAAAPPAVVAPSAPSAPPPGEVSLVWTTPQTRLTSRFGYRVNPVTGGPAQLHQGVDVPAPKGSQVVAIEDGVVTFAGWTETGGHTLVLAHDGGWVTRYIHLSSTRVRTGARVKAGQLIALSGDTGSLTTGPHLHFEILRGNAPVNPLAFRFHSASGQAAAP